MEARPTCWPDGQACPNPCADHPCRRTVHNITPLHGGWSGLRMADADTTAHLQASYTAASRRCKMS
jgi:hypothetical protein